MQNLVAFVTFDFVLTERENAEKAATTIALQFKLSPWKSISGFQDKLKWYNRQESKAFHLEATQNQLDAFPPTEEPHDLNFHIFRAIYEVFLPHYKYISLFC